MVTATTLSAPPDGARARRTALPAGSPGLVGRRAWAWAALAIPAAVLLAALIVDPFREFLSQDDGWAYAHSVERLLASGRYELDSWSAANMPVQIYFAGFLAKLFGYSLSLLRVSTLLLLVAGLGAFFALSLRNRQPDVRVSAILTLGLFARP